MAARKAKLLVARESFACEVDGRETVVSQGTRVPAGHPVVKGREHLFGPDEPQPDLEQPPAKRRRAGK